MLTPDTTLRWCELLIAEPSANVIPLSSQDPALLLFDRLSVAILDGHYADVLEAAEVKSAVQHVENTEVFRSPASPAAQIASLVAHLGHTLGADVTHLVAIAALQLFLQANCTGPNLADDVFPAVVSRASAADLVAMLSISGQTAYDRTRRPDLLVVALAALEHLQSGTPALTAVAAGADIEHSTASGSGHVTSASTARAASVCWWRLRALQAHMMVLSEPCDVLAAVANALLAPKLVELVAPAPGTDSARQRTTQLVFWLEAARGGVHAQTEHLLVAPLRRAVAVSGLDFVLTGAKAKRTKFQTFHTAALVLLAKSANFQAGENVHTSAQPHAHALDSDLLLERPQYEQLADVALDVHDNKKRIRIELPDAGAAAAAASADDRLFPVVAQPADLPTSLRGLDPNTQPPLAILDSVQLLLRVAVLRQTSPAGNAMVDEELAAAVQRIVYSEPGHSNWLVFGRALWERSLVETSRAKTVERGILQMTSLVEELGMHVQLMMPAGSVADAPGAATRLRYVHQLPLMPEWAMHARLAEKYMLLGVLRSALEIYKRLDMPVEMALCHAAVGEEHDARAVLERRIAACPSDARAVSILGDLTGDPALWERAWETGRYAKAKASLSRFWHQKHDVAAAAAHMRDCLAVAPLLYENWFFYGCLGLEAADFEQALEAFTRCVLLDDSALHAWLNLALALLQLDKPRPAFLALKRAVQSGEGAHRSWRIFENYVTVAARLGEWNDVLWATRELLKIADASGRAVDMDVTEKLAAVLVAEPYAGRADGGAGRVLYFQRLALEFFTDELTQAADARVWRLVAKIEVWRGRPWAALECHEKAYRACSSSPDLDTSDEAWNAAVDAAVELVAAYENWGELPGRLGAGDVVCKDWRYKARTAVRSLRLKGKMWEDSRGWETLGEALELLRA